MNDKIDSHLSKHEYNKKYYEANKPYPFRLGELKTKLQQDAFEQDLSMADVLRKIVSDHYDHQQREELKKSFKEIMAPLSKLP